MDNNKYKIKVLRLILNDYCNKVVPNLFRNSASVLAKKENVVSYPTHIINVVFTAASLYSVDHLNPESENSIRDLKLLISIVTLHDIGKYFENKYKIKGGNSKENIKKYFENDDFKIKEFFPEIEKMIENNETFNEIVWLIQNTELRDDSCTETLTHKTEFGRLADYSRLGDKIASLTKDEHYVSEIFNTLKEYDVHVVEIPKFPQFLIRRCLMKVLKKYYEEKGAIPFLLFEDGLFYINNGIIFPEPDDIKNDLILSIKESMKSCEEEPLLNIRINFQSIDDTSVLNSPLSEKEKKKIILEQIIKKIPTAMKDITIVLPSDEKIMYKLATIIYYIYKSKDLKLLNNNQLVGKIESLKKHVSEGGVGPQKYKIYTAKELFENYKSYDLDSIYEPCDKFLDEKLKKHNVANVFENIIKNISVDLQQAFEVEDIPENKDKLCFLCGSKANEVYRAEKGYFLQAREFSKRGKVSSMQKKICSLCLIEKNLIDSLFRDKGYKLSGNYLFAIFYFDRIFANVSYFSKEFSNVPLVPEVSIDEKVNFRLGNFEGMYHIEPCCYSGRDEPSIQSNRVNITRQIFGFIKKYGCKATLTPPYTLLRTYNELFVNENPIRLEMSLNIHVVHDFDELNKIKAFLDEIYNIDKKKGYFKVQSYNLLSFIHFVKNERNNLNNMKSKYIIIKNCFGEEIMKIEEIAKAGKEIYSTGRVEWESTYKRTLLMRTVLDYILIGLQQRFSEGELKIFVAGGLYKLLIRERYAKKKDADKYVEKFVDILIQYLKEKKWFSVHSLNSIKKYLVDAYEFALISISKEQESIKK